VFRLCGQRRRVFLSVGGSKLKNVKTDRRLVYEVSVL
jgi:hypothetical protein